MWTVPVGSDAYRLDDVPFFARGVSSDDIVRAKREDGVLFFAGLVEAGGHSTVRVLIWNRTRQAVPLRTGLDGMFIRGSEHPGLVAVGITPSARYADVH